jgi:hypothetical protein
MAAVTPNTSKVLINVIMIFAPEFKAEDLPVRTRRPRVLVQAPEPVPVVQTPVFVPVVQTPMFVPVVRTGFTLKKKLIVKQTVKL